MSSALDRIVHRALRKPVEERYQTADAFAQDLRSTLLGTDTADVSRIRPMSRLVVLPFRMLRPNPAIEFLAFSLADAISSALSGLPSLVVRSTAAASRLCRRHAGHPGALRGAGRGRRAAGDAAQQRRPGTGERAARRGSIGDAGPGDDGAIAGGEIFQLQDSLAKSIVESLSLSLTAADEGRINRDAPANPEAYDLYLRANQIQLDSKQWTAARDLYLRCLERDPQFAPAWARLGRCYRLLGKYGDPSQAQANLALGEQALKRALEINPDLSLAHNLYAHVEVDAGHAREAVARLLERVRHAVSEPELFAGLVQACRYCGLLDASVAAHERARRLDPGVVTSVAQTFLLNGEWERAIADDRSDPPFTKAIGARPARSCIRRARAAAGRRCARAATAAPQPCRGHDRRVRGEARRSDSPDSPGRSTRGLAIRKCSITGPARSRRRAITTDRSGLLERAIEGGFHPASALVIDPRFDSVRALSDFSKLVRRADELQREAFETFRAADGPRLLGLPHVRTAQMAADSRKILLMFSLRAQRALPFDEPRASRACRGMR